ncbi:uncharacterized protein LOC134538302 [Bacillus rossius redtenbacheri]|uniref:uncharacterized protein LOC134538302 n=1 Tax=Bacillus rossius redtenbacheri TaxID=93214 RepID=UPI002FDE1FB2
MTAGPPQPLGRRSRLPFACRSDDCVLQLFLNAPYLSDTQRAMHIRNRIVRMYRARVDRQWLRRGGEATRRRQVSWNPLVQVLFFDKDSPSGDAVETALRLLHGSQG